MKKALALMTASAMALSLAACGGSASTASSTASSASSAAESVVESAAAAAGTSVTKDNIKFGFLAPTLQTEFFIGIDDGLKQVAAEDGWDYTSVSFENDSGTAVTDIENMVTSGCNVILAMVSDSSCVPHRKPAPSLSSVASLLMSMTSASTPASTISVP